MDAATLTRREDRSWENELAQLLADLTSIQAELLDVLEAKRSSISRNDLSESTELRTRAEELVQRLEGCHARRAALLRAVELDGEPAENLGKLATRATRENRAKLVRQVKEASQRMRLLHHHSLSNWVLAQRTLLHVAQMLEIIASGGRLQPTYGSGEPFSSGGTLVDHAA